MIQLSDAVQRKAQNIRLLICDVDGVLSTGLVYLLDEAIELKSFHVQDGMGLQLVQRANIDVAIISSRKAACVDQRMAALGVKHVFQGVQDKLTCYQQLKRQLQCEDEMICYVGDDLPDLPILRQVGLAIAVANANTSLAPHVHWTTSRPGGHGAVREVCDLLLDCQQQLTKLVSQYQ